MLEIIQNLFSSKELLSIPLVAGVIISYFLYRGVKFVVKILLYIAIFIIAGYLIYQFMI